jgi:3-phenylpropionate/cinnamic acid dioxygenase small subunit
MPAERDDLAEIRDLLARYCTYLDRSERDAWIQLFSPEGRYEVFGRAFEGHEGLAEMYDTSPGGLHLTGDSLIELHGDTAEVKQSYLFVDQVTRELRIGYYDDDVVRSEEGWRFLRRRSTFLTHRGPAERPTGRRAVQDVYNALARYDLLLDGGAHEEWGSLFADDSVLEVAGQRFATPEARAAIASGWPRGHHQTSLPILTGNIETGELSASSRFCFFDPAGSPPRFGTCDDELIVRRGAWRFRSRAISLDDR